jgi:hypothetical protein
VGRPPGLHGFDDLGVVDALQVDGGDAEVAVAELAVDDYERNAFAGEFDSILLRTAISLTPAQ